jgi:phospholipase/carboxylesterase
MADVVTSQVRLHQGQAVLVGGQTLDRAQAALVLVHGRGGTARAMLRLGDELAQPDLALLAPQAADNVWYPHSFMAAVESNEPYLSSALAAVGGVLEGLEGSGIPAQQVVLLGFSQGACLGCGSTDPYIPRSRVEETEKVLRQLGAQVTMRLYPHIRHAINIDELEFVRSMLSRLTRRDGDGSQD